MKRSVLVLIVVIGVLLLSACSTSAVTEKPAPALTSEQKNVAIQVIKEYPEVRDAAISQEGKELSLVVVVDYSTSTTKAKNLGDNHFIN